MFTSSATSSDLPRGDRWFLLALLVLACGLRLLYAAHFRLDSDEPQHLHVVWAWSQGMLPYRDVFDNHSPVFQAACAPLFAWLGPRADIVIPMRVALFPLFLGTIWIVARLGRVLVSARAGWWAAAIAALCPPYFLTSVEFRPDQLWTFLWLLTLLVLLGGRMTPRRAWWAGLVMGAAFSVSMKSTVMLIALSTGALAMLVLLRPNWRTTLSILGAFFGGIIVLPALVTLYFVAHGAAHEFYQCVIGHNLTAGSSTTSHLSRRLLRWVGFTSVSLLLALGLRKLAPDDRRRDAVFFLSFTAFSYYTALKSFWPILTLEDFIPLYPCLFGAVAPLLIFPSARLRRPWLFPSLAVVVELAIVLWTSPPLRDDTREKIAIVADTLRLTDPGDFVMDGKGETIYRRRPTYLIMEGVTTRGIKAGRIKNDVEERLIATGTPLLTPHRLPGANRPFARANYLPIAFRLMVLGKWLEVPKGTSPPTAVGFDVVIPARYRVVSEAGDLKGSLDGRPVAEAQALAAGHHTLQFQSRSGRIALVWAQALERGYSPFADITPDHPMARD